MRDILAVFVALASLAYGNWWATAFLAVVLITQELLCRRRNQ